MKEIRNKTSRPIRIPLPGGKLLHLGPGKVAQISDKTTQHAGVQRLVEDGSIEILGESERTEGITGSAANAEQTHGRAKSPFRRRQGER